MTTDFMDMGLHPQLVQAVIEIGYLEATPIQAEVIPLMLAGHDVIGRAQTGTGKTAAFMLPILHKLQPGRQIPQALVLAPTRELAIQVAEVTHAYGQHMHSRVIAVYGGAPYGPQLGGLRRGMDIVVGTPGRLIDLLERGALDLSAIHTIILDEADEMLSMGFIEDIQKILSALPETHQTALFSATMPAEIRRLAEQYMVEPHMVNIEPEQPTVAAIDQRYIVVRQNDKNAAMARLIETEEIYSALVFTRTRLGSADLASELAGQGYPVEVLNGDLSQDVRERVINRFRQNQIKILIATDVAARGLDIENISHVFNFDLPEDPEAYVHRIGRTGRAGKTGIAISFVTPSEQWRLRRIENFIHHTIQKMPIPTTQEILDRREAQFLDRISETFTKNIHPERKLVSDMVASGVDLLDLAAAALKLARGEEINRPIAEIAIIPERPPRRETSYSSNSSSGRRYPAPAASDSPRRAPRRRRAEAAESRREFEGAPRRDFDAGPAREPGMVRLELDIGRSHGIRPADIVGTIAYHADIPGRSIGRIQIQDQASLVDIPENMVNLVMSKNGKYRVRKQKFTVRHTGN